MKTKISVSFSVSNYGADPRVVTRALLKKKDYKFKKGSNAGVLVVAPKHEIKNFSTLQLIAAQHACLDELDNLLDTGRGAKLVIDDVPAELVTAKRKTDGSVYNCILVDLGSKEAPHVRAFYLSDMQNQLIKLGAFVPEAEFTMIESDVIEDEDDGEETEEDSE